MTVIYFILVFNVTEQYKIIHGLHFISIKQHCLRTQTLVGWWWHTKPSTRQSKEDGSEFEASLVYTVSSRTARTVTQKTLS